MHSSTPFSSSSHPSHSGGWFVGPPSRAPSPDSPATLRPPHHVAQPTHHSLPTSPSPPPPPQQHHRSSVLSLSSGSGKHSTALPSSISSSASPAPLSAPSSSFASTLPSAQNTSVVSASNIDFANDSTRSLRTRIEQLERENAELKRSMLELGIAYNRAVIQVRERWKAAVRAGGMGGEAAQTVMDGVGVISLSNKCNTAAAAAGEGKVRRQRAGGERRGREGHRSASPALSAERDLTGNGVSVSVGDEDEEEEMQIERVMSACSFSSSRSPPHHSNPHASQHHHHAATFALPTPPSRLFSKRLNLLGHSGAVYALTFSGDGGLVASAGMDKTIRVWDMHAILSYTSSNTASSSPLSTASASAHYQLLNLSAHTLNISSLAFAIPASSHSPSSPTPSSHLISASFDKTVAFHDLSTGTTIRSVNVGSFATSLAPSSLSGGQICYVGTTGKRLLTLDRRVGSMVGSWDNDTMVSAVSIYRDASSEAAAGGSDEMILTGDHGGLIRMWSSRMQRRMHSQPNDPHNKPISHLHCLHTSAIQGRPGNEHVEDDEDDHDQRTLIATNSFDDVLRVYESRRDTGVGKGGGVDAATTNGDTDDFRLLYELKGVKNQNWPIKSAFYRGKEWHERQQWMELNDLLSSSSSGSSSSSPPSSPSSPHSHSSLSSDDDRVDRGSSAPAASTSGRVVDVTSQYRPRQRPPSSAAATAAFSLPHSRLLASGSADGCVYVFDVTAGRGIRGRVGVVDSSGSGVEGESRLLQRLEGHRDRVYTCAFHPVEPVLLSAGADATVQVWTAGNS